MSLFFPDFSSVPYPSDPPLLPSCSQPGFGPGLRRTFPFFFHTHLLSAFPPSWHPCSSFSQFVRTSLSTERSTALRQLIVTPLFPCPFFLFLRALPQPLFSPPRRTSARSSLILSAIPPCLPICRRRRGPPITKFFLFFTFFFITHFFRFSLILGFRSQCDSFLRPPRYFFCVWTI